MKKGLVTFILCLVVGLFLWAQPKKPVVAQKKKPAVVQKKTTTKTVQKTKAQATPSKAVPGVQEQVTRGQAVYMRVCVVCHQKDGGGVPHMTPPLINTSYVLGDKKRLINIVLKGLNQKIEIEDEEYTNPMPPQPQLTDQEIADVLTFIRNNFGNKASPVTTAEVKAMRS